MAAEDLHGWYRETSESMRLLDIERRKVAREEARYVCARCSAVIEPDYSLSDWLNRVRAWMWRQAHRLNCQ